MVSEVEFRIGNEADALCVGVLAIQVFLDTYAKDGIRPDLAREVLNNYSPDAFSVRLMEQDTTFVIAERGGCSLGFCEVARSRQCPVAAAVGKVELVRLYVQRSSQRLGLGRALMGRAEMLAMEASADSLWLTAWTGNAQALAFYHALGYNAVGATAYAFEDQIYENKVLVKTKLGRAT